MADISKQAARKALGRAIVGHAWRGHTLEVRKVVGRGGRSGMTLQVSLNSLQRALEGGSEGALALPDATHRLTAGSDQGTLVQARFRVIESALQHPRGSPDRAKAVRALVTAGCQSERTLQRWIDLYERHGMPGLARKRPKDAGRARVVVSRDFDKAFTAAGGERHHLERLGAALDTKIKSIWQSPVEASGWAHVRDRAKFQLEKLCEEEGFTLARAAFELSRRHIERFTHHRIVNTMRNNRKAFDDGKPRITRDWTGLAPMECIVADVKHLDVVLQRPDGSQTWPKVIGFHDAGTGRVFLYLVLLAPGEGVRQEHVIEAFMAMVADPMWGFPQSLYLDNGSEFAIFERIRTAIDLVSQDDGRPIIYAKPYNASAKTIENMFKRLDQYLFSTMPGYVGGDRMNKKTQTVGKPPKPWPGTLDEFRATLHGLLISFNARPVGGQWGGRSADDWVREKQAAGWRPVSVDPLVLDSAFCTFFQRKIDRGVLKIGGQRFYHPALDSLPHRSSIDIALPWRRNATPLFRPPSGAWAYLTPDIALPAMWQDGAVESGRRQRNYVRAMSDMSKGVPVFDPVAADLEMAARYSPPALSGRSHQLDVGGEIRALADGRAGQGKPSALSLEDREQRRRDAETARLLKGKSNAA